MKDRIITALDLRGFENIKELVDKLDEAIWFKVGAVNFTAYSSQLIDYLKSKKKKIFLDLKYHDIPNTVKESVFAAAHLGINMLTIHSIGGIDMMKAAIDGSKAFEDETSTEGPVIAAVTVLTSFDSESLKKYMFVDMDVEKMVLKLAENAYKAGIRALVLSAKETSLIRKEFGKEFTIITPGIRPAWAKKNDQKRITTPADAIKNGSDFLVIGRPIYASENPATSFKKIVEEVEDVKF
ncbi:orotidine-5'-phosphate decarboxylase [Hippea jasoniae]|uniref:orotidine-5'-phosphate decarboxylase n=1 Tax=Hippea jasoniae TaxID=944479 RepID=UPI00055366BD|nr:orotidine-5'-phosphate decarboxylase [Hippea jasoniae]